MTVYVQMDRSDENPDLDVVPKVIGCHTVKVRDSRRKFLWDGGGEGDGRFRVHRSLPSYEPGGVGRDVCGTEVRSSKDHPFGGCVCVTS